MLFLRVPAARPSGLSSVGETGLLIKTDRLLSCDEGIAPYDLENQEYAVIAYWMERFIREARKKDSGQDYPPDTLYALVRTSCLSTTPYPHCWKTPELDFFKQPEFDDMKRTLDAKMKELTEKGVDTGKRTLDAKMKELTEKGVDTGKRKAQIITEEMEDYLWESKLLGDHSPLALLDTIVFCNGLYFALRSGKEHRQLRAKPCQITVVDELEQRPYLLYCESSSTNKNKPAGLKGRNRPKKKLSNMPTWKTLLAALFDCSKFINRSAQRIVQMKPFI